MKHNKYLLLVALGCSAMISFTGCSKAPQAPPKEVTVQADDKMRFDVTEFDVRPGQKVVITLKNIGTTPKFSMGHNLVVLDKQITEQNIQAKFLDPAAMEAGHDYVPATDKNVIKATKLLGPNETDTMLMLSESSFTTQTSSFVRGHTETGSIPTGISFESSGMG